MLKNGGADEFAANIRLNHERVGFAFAHAKAADVVLHVALVVIGVVGIVEQLPARRFQIVNPGQPMAVDEIGVEAKSNE